MNLPPPFGDASDIRANPDGSINLVDDQGKPLVRIPLATAFELSAKAEGYGYGDGRWNGAGDGFGYGMCYGRAEVDGSGRGKSK